MTDLGIGIVGCGQMGRTFAECLRGYCRGGNLVAVTGGTRAPALAAEYGVAAVGSVEELLARRDVDAVIVASPHADHRDQVVAAARAKKHVFLEKPMEVSVARCDEMIRACRENGVTLCVAHVVRFRGSPRAGKQLIDAGKLGRVEMIHVTWRTVGTRTTDKTWSLDPIHGGIFLDAGVHMFDLMRWYAGAEATRVFGTVRRFTDTPVVKPTAMVQVEFANGVIGFLWLCFELPKPGVEGAYQRVQVVGSEGMIDSDSYGVARAAVGGIWQTIWEQPPMDLFDNYLNPTRLESFSAELQDFLDAVRVGRPPFATGADGRAAVEIVEAANRSSETGEAVKLPLVDAARPETPR